MTFFFFFKKRIFKICPLTVSYMYTMNFDHIYSPLPTPLLLTPNMSPFLYERRIKNKRKKRITDRRATFALVIVT